jgi:CRISPR-associated protein (TIGR02584 family)
MFLNFSNIANNLFLTGIYLMQKKANKKVLLSILGMSPQILTETVYALSQQKKPFIPDEIYVLTTKLGAKNCKLALFHENGGWFHKLCQTYNLTNINFTEKHVISTVDEEGELIDDIRTQGDNRAVANQITQFIRDLTSDNTVALHVSIAGGRKTMGFYAGYALSMFGRDQDRLSHVLVQEEYEGEPEFFFPTKVTDTFKPRFRNQFLDRKDAIIELADLPFVRMSKAINKNYLKQAKTFDDCVGVLQKSVSEDVETVLLDVEEKCLVIGDEKVYLSEANFTFYYWMVKKMQSNLTITASQYDSGENETYTDEFRSCLDELFGMGCSTRFDDDSVKTSNGFRGVTYEFIRDRKTQIKKKLTEKLGVNHSFYEIQKVGDKPVRYGLKLPLDRVSVKFKS